MNNIYKGIMAGLAATTVLSLLMLGKAGMGVMPALDPIGMIATMMGISLAMAWGIHFIIGTVMWGGAFALLEARLPGGDMWVKGMAFGVGAWLIMMVVMMPMAGQGLFGMQLGMMAPIMTLLMHIVFGGVLGAVYGLLLQRGAVASA